MNSKWIDDALAAMTIEEKVGQTLMYCIFRLEEDTLADAMEAIDEYRLGGIFHFDSYPIMQGVP